MARLGKQNVHIWWLVESVAFDGPLCLVLASHGYLFEFFQFPVFLHILTAEIIDLFNKHTT